MQTAPAQETSESSIEGACTAQELQSILGGLKAHADKYTTELLALRHDYLSCGRRGRDVEDAKEGMRQRARRIDTLGDLAAYGIRRMVLCCFLGLLERFYAAVSTMTLQWQVFCS